MMAASLPRWNFCTCHSVTWWTKPVVALQNVGCFLRLFSCWLKYFKVCYERHNINCCLTSSWFLEPWLPSSVLLTLPPAFSSAGAGIWCTQLLQGRTTVVNIQSQRAKIRKSCLIAQGWWILPSGVYFVLNLPLRKGKLLGGIHMAEVLQDKRVNF